MIPRMAVEPQAFVTLPKATAGVLGDDPVERLNHGSSRVAIPFIAR